MEDYDDDNVDSYGGGGSKKPKKSAKPAQIIKLTDSDEGFPTDLPQGTRKTDFDWSDTMGVIREVVDQGNRRTCWTVSTSRSLSGRLVIAKKFDHPLRLSSLHLLVGLIDRVDSTGGLQNLEHLQKFLVDNGTVLEEDCKCPQLALEFKNDKSTPNPQLCTQKNKAKHVRMFKVENLIIMDQVDERELMRLVIEGPVAVGINVYYEFSSFKGDGIYKGPQKGSIMTDKHLILVSGYGTKLPECIHYWNVQNSAGKSWGNNGYGKIIRQISLGKNEPSLFKSIIYPKLLDHYEGQREHA